MVELITNNNPVLNTEKINPIIKRNRLTAFFLTHLSLFLNLITFGIVKRNKYIKYISSNGTIKYVATKHLVETIFEKTLLNKDVIKKIRTDKKIQEFSVKLLDTFKNGIVNDSSFHKLPLGEKKFIELKDVDIKKINDIKKIVSAELEKIALEKASQSTKEFPFYWQDYFQLDNQLKEKFKTKIESLYGASLASQLFALNDKSKISLSLKNSLDEIYNKEMDNFENSLQSGDIIFFKLDKSKFSFTSLFKKDERVDYIILKGQKIAKNWLQGPSENSSHSFIHVGIIHKEEGRRALLIEATPGNHGDDIRSLELRSIAGRLLPESKVQYRISRMKDASLSHNTAKVALLSSNYVEYDENCKPTNIHPRISIKEKDKTALQKTDLHYSKKNATKSIFLNTKLKFKSIKNIFESFAYYHKEKTAFLKNGKSEGLFCSYFTSFSIQYAEASKIISEIIEENNYDFDFNSMNAEEVESWASKMAKEHGHKLKLTINNNSKNISPQKLRSIFHKNFNAFSDVLNIIPPTA